MATKTPIYHKKNDRSGFALLMTLIVVTVVISIGLTVLDLSLKQLRLSTNAKDSEIAFHAASAGMECARFWRRAASSTLEAGNAFTPSCFSGAVSGNTNSAIPGIVAANGIARLYNYAITWPDNLHCSQITTLVISATQNGSGVTVNDVRDYIPAYRDGNTKTCAPGEKCTIIAVRGYNRACNAVTGYGVVQREVLVQF